MCVPAAVRGASGAVNSKEAKAQAKAVLGEYTKEMYIIDIVCFWIGCALMGICALYIAPLMEMAIAPHLLAVFVMGNLTADVSTGMVHWLADTYGSVDLPIIGKTLLRPFRYHHVDPVAMTRTSIYETSGSNHMAASLGLGWLWWRLHHFQGPEHEDLADFLFFVYIYVMFSFIAFTNLFHRWSHMYRTPKYVNVLQATPFVIGKAHHREHHVNPHDIYYCITSGIMNYPMELIGFFRGLEHAIEVLTGMGPRVDDGQWLSTTKAGALD